MATNMIPAAVRSICLFLLCGAAPLWGTTVIPPTFDDLVAKADVIFEGRVVNAQSLWVGADATRHIQTDYTFQVNETLKGEVPAQYTLHVMGGTVGEVKFEVDGAPNFHLGDRVLLFVRKNGVKFVPLVGVMHGHYRVETDAKTNQEVLIKHDGSPLRALQDVGRDDLESGARTEKSVAPQPGARPLTPKAFKDEVRAKLKEQSH